MSLATCVRGYIQEMIATPGLKALVLDADTAGVVSVVAPMSEVLARDVVLVDRIESVRDPLHEAKAICFLRPSSVCE